MIRYDILAVLAVIVLLPAAIYANGPSDSLNSIVDEYIYPTSEFSYKKPVTIAILPFSNDTGDEKLDWLSNGIPENLITRFSASQSVRLIDRGLIGEIVDQLGLSISDLADPEKALKVGKLVAAKIIVRGSYQKRPDGIVKVIGRFTDVETGTILKAIEKIDSMKNIDNLIEQFSRELVLTIDPEAKIVYSEIRHLKSRTKVMLQSMIWPGWGDLPDRKISGALMTTLQLGTLGMLILYQFDYMGKLDEYNKASEDYKDIEKFSTYEEYKARRQLMLSTHEKATDSKKLRDIFLLSAILGVRIIGVLESAIFMPRAIGEEISVTSSIDDRSSFALSWRQKF